MIGRVFFLILPSLSLLNILEILAKKKSKRKIFLIYIIYSLTLVDLKFYHNIFPYVSYHPVKFHLYPIYSLKDMSDLTKLVNRHFKTKLRPNLVFIKDESKF